MDYLTTSEELILSTGGNVINHRYVTQFGVTIVSKTEEFIPAKIAQVFNLSTEQKGMELNAKLTYLNSKITSADYVENIFSVRGEKSIANNIHVGFIIAGIKEETVLELASSYANISRQTTSKTKSATDTLYVIQDEADIPYIEEFLRLREIWKSRFDLTGKKDYTLERANEFNLCTKAMSITMSMSLQDWSSYLGRKINTGYEYELERVCIEIRKQLSTLYPNFFN